MGVFPDDCLDDSLYCFETSDSLFEMMLRTEKEMALGSSFVPQASKNISSLVH